MGPRVVLMKSGECGSTESMLDAVWRIVAVDRAIARLTAGAAEQEIPLLNGERVSCGSAMVPTLREYVGDLREMAAEKGLLV